MKRSRSLSLVLVLACCLLLLAACNEEHAPKTTLPQLNNGMSGGKLSFPHVMDNGRVALASQFSTSYDTAKWRVTDSKTINLQLTASQIPAGATVLVEHVHIDVSLKSTLAMLDGWKQDTADFKLSTGADPGVQVSPLYPYVNVMAIEGFSQTLIDSWSYYTDSYSITDDEQKRLTEDNLVKEGGVYANEIQVVWFLLIKYADEKYYHAGVATDEFVIPVANAHS